MYSQLLRATLRSERRHWSTPVLSHTSTTKTKTIVPHRGPLAVLHRQPPTQAYTRDNHRDTHSTESGGWFSSRYGIGCAVGAGMAGGATMAYDSNENSKTPIGSEAREASKKSEVKAADKESVRTAVSVLLRLFGSDKVRVDEDTTEELSKAKYSHHTGRKPACVVYPETTNDVSTIMKVCQQFGCPVVPYGCGTSLEGHVVLTTEGIIMNLMNMQKVVNVREGDGDLTVETGVQWTDLNEELKQKGYEFFFPIDPGPGASIGGMCATCCSGTNAVRYGTLKDWVKSLTVVLPDGQVVVTGNRGGYIAGYNLSDLFIGSEGTLGVVTEATLRLAKLPSKEAVIVAPFNSIYDAAQCAAEIARKDLQVNACEMIDDRVAEILNSEAALGERQLAHKPTLLIKVCGDEKEIQSSKKVVQNVVAKHLGSSPQSSIWAVEGDDAQLVWAARKGALWSFLSFMERKHSDRRMSLWTTDVCVPLGTISTVLNDTLEDMKRSGMDVGLIAHAGDGNFHVLIPIDRDDPETFKVAEAACERMYDRAIEAGGTCTGEHGVGTGKKEPLKRQLQPEAYQLMKSLKHLLDEKDILNRGKVLDMQHTPVARVLTRSPLPHAQ